MNVSIERLSETATTFYKDTWTKKTFTRTVLNNNLLTKLVVITPIIWVKGSAKDTIHQRKRRRLELLRICLILTQQTPRATSVLLTWKVSILKVRYSAKNQNSTISTPFSTNRWKSRNKNRIKMRWWENSSRIYSFD